MDSIDKLLAQLKAEYQEPAIPEPIKQQPPHEALQQPKVKRESSLDDLLGDLQATPEQTKQQQPPVETFKQPLPKSASLVNNLLADVKAQYEEQDRAEELRRQQELQQEQIRQQQLKAQQLEALKSQAKAWLAKLDPLSSEGLWFEKFAEKYASKLEAAIDYLQDLQDSDR